ncbi:hypothetical protein HUA74_41750 [Myxococcus sp. CA051A]|nr:DUF1629 domain-containing protein [Myxococcus sp. CA051A]NTX67194.1 hypothetical protein [Myxococcus sp. CA051A]
MTSRYFDLSDDVRIRGRWELGVPTDISGREVDDPWMFRKGQAVTAPGHLMLPVEREGKALDFSLIGFSTPLVHSRVAAVFVELAGSDVQVIPVEIPGHADGFRILVAARLLPCIDEVASERVERWTAEDGRPEKVGQYRDVRGLRIDPAQVGDAKVFRPWGWSIALIVSEDIKQALERLGATGTHFIEV